MGEVGLGDTGVRGQTLCRKEVGWVVHNAPRVDLLQLRHQHAIVVHQHFNQLRVLYGRVVMAWEIDRTTLQDANERESFVVECSAECRIQVRGHELGGLRHERGVGRAERGGERVHRRQQCASRMRVGGYPPWRRG